MIAVATTLLNMVSDQCIPVDIIAGFRGAGKTTLIRAMADSLWPDVFLLILQNEEGREVLPTSWREGSRISEQWRGGCICCSASMLFGTMLTELGDRFRPGRILIELAETARLDDVKALFTQLGGRFVIDHIIYVVNAVSFEERMNLSKAFVEKQLKETPAVWVNRLPEKGDSMRRRVLSAIAEANPRCAVLDETFSLESLISQSKVYQKIRRSSLYKRREN